MSAINVACGGPLESNADFASVSSAAALYANLLNDANWSCENARSAGLRRLAHALAGTSVIDNVRFAEMVTETMIRRLLPIGLRAQGHHDVAIQCQEQGDRKAARLASQTMPQESLSPYLTAEVAFGTADNAKFARGYESVFVNHALELAAYAARGLSEKLNRHDQLMTDVADMCAEILENMMNPEKLGIN